MTPSNSSTAADLDYRPPFYEALPLGLQHVLIMLASNVAPALIIADAAGLTEADRIYLVQLAMICAGVATLVQTIGFGAIGARLPIFQGTSFAFVPIMLPIAKLSGIGAVIGGAVIGGAFHFLLGFVVDHLRRWISPLVVGSVVLIIGLTLIPIGIDYAAGGTPARLAGDPDYGSLKNWSLAGIVILVTLALAFLGHGIFAMAATMIGVIVGYGVAALFGLVTFDSIGSAGWITWPHPLILGFEVTAFAVTAMCLMAIVSTIETIGDVSVITGTVGRLPDRREITGATFADGLGTMFSGLFGGLPNTSFSQNAGLIMMTGLMSRYVVSLGAGLLILAGLVPKFGLLIALIPTPVLGGAMIIMFGMVTAAGLRILAQTAMTRRNITILALTLAVALGLRAMPDALSHIPYELVRLLLTTGLLPAVFLSIALDAIIPEDFGEYDE